MMNKEFEDLFTFISNPQTKLKSLEIMSACSADPFFVKYIQSSLNKNILSIFNEISSPGCEEHVMKIILNLSNHDFVTNAIVEIKGISLIFEIINDLIKKFKKNSEEKYVRGIKLTKEEYIVEDTMNLEKIELCLMILSNLTREKVAIEFLIPTKNEKFAFIFPQIINMFFLYENKAFDFVTSIISNITTIKEGVDELIKLIKCQSILELLSKQILSPSLIRSLHSIEIVLHLFNYYSNFDEINGNSIEETKIIIRNLMTLFIALNRDMYETVSLPNTTWNQSINQIENNIKISKLTSEHSYRISQTIIDTLIQFSLINKYKNYIKEEKMDKMIIDCMDRSIDAKYVDSLAKLFDFYI